MIDQSAVGPPIFSLLEDDRCRSTGPLFASQQIIGSRRYRERRADTPDPTGSRWRLRREKQTLQCIPQAGLTARAHHDVSLTDEREDSARDHVPVLADGEWNHRLDIEGELAAVVVRVEAIVVVELQRHADEARDRIRE